MPGLSSIYQPGPWHILSYGTLLGTNMFQTFVGGIVAYQALPRPSFAQLQKALTPYLFAIQTAFPVLLALTFPVPQQGSVSSSSSIQAVLFDPQHRNSKLVPLAIMFVSGVANLAVFGPATTKTMIERKHQETRDGKRYHDSGPKSAEMQKLNTRFNVLHSISSIFNLVGVIASIGYGWVLGSRIA